MLVKRLISLSWRAISALLLLYLLMIVIVTIPQLIKIIYIMEKQLFIDLIVIFISLLAFFWYRNTTKKTQGLKSSISKAAGWYQKNGLRIYTYIFMFFAIVIPFYYLGNTWIMIVCSMLISGIAGITGYNPKLKSAKLQDFMHVFLTLISIVGYMVGIISINKWFSIPIGLWFIYMVYNWAKKTYQHTRKIEEAAYYVGIGCLFINCVIK